MEINKRNGLMIKNAKPREKPYRLSDGGGPYLVVSPSGGKLWRRSYEFNGKAKLLSYGPYPAVGLSKARELHSEAQALKRQGTDPAAAKQARKRQEEESEQTPSTPTVAVVIDEWFRTWSEHKSSTSALEPERSWLRARAGGGMMPDLLDQGNSR